MEEPQRGYWMATRRASARLVVVPVLAFVVLHADSSAITGRMNIARSGHQATLLMDGRVLVTGGSDQGGQAIGRAEIYNPLRGLFPIPHSKANEIIGVGITDWLPQ